MSDQLSFWEVDVNRMKPKQFGTEGEKVAATLFERAGYDVAATVGRGDRRGDLRVIDPKTGEVWRVEVKSARHSQVGWQFCLRRRTTRLCTDVGHADLLMLLAFPRIGNPVVFLIPVAELGLMKQLVFRAQHPADYAGKWAVYRQRGRLTIGGKYEAS